MYKKQEVSVQCSEINSLHADGWGVCITEPWTFQSVARVRTHSAGINTVLQNDVRSWHVKVKWYSCVCTCHMHWRKICLTVLTDMGSKSILFDSVEVKQIRCMWGIFKSKQCLDWPLNNEILVWKSGCNSVSTSLMQQTTGDCSSVLHILSTCNRLIKYWNLLLAHQIFRLASG